MESAHIFRILTLCLAALAVTHAELEIKVYLSKAKADLGDDVQIKCHIINKDEETFHVVWVKKIGTHVEEIGTNSKMNRNFEATQRYSGAVEFAVDQDVSDVTFILNIKAVEAIDSGELGCKLPMFEMIVFEDLVVKVPFASLVMSSRDLDGSHHVTYQTGDSIEFDEEERRDFTCRATGGYPEPTLTLTLGDKDVTSQFNKSVELVKQGTPGLYALSYDIELKNPNLEITYEYSRKKLQCSASIPGTDFKNATSIDVKLTGYKPQFKCEEVIQMALHEEDVNITCRVHADPPINHNQTMYYWGRTATSNDTILPGNSIGQFTAMMENGVDPYEQVMTLHIDHVFKHHFRTYYFEVTNELGSVTQGVELRQAPYHVETENPSVGGTGQEVPGKKDRPNGAASLSRLLHGVTFTAVLMVVLL